MPTLTREDDVFVLHLGDDENRFHPDWMTAVEGHLTEVAATEAPRALVVTAGGKFFSNGLDLDWLGANPDQINPYVVQVCGLFASFLSAGVPTVAAIQGHCFAAGAMLSLACDVRVMRADRGFWCLPEADIRIPFTIGMDALIRSRLTKKTAHEAMVTARRYGGNEAFEAGIVEAVTSEDRVLPEAIARAAALASKDPQTMATIKGRMYADTLVALRSDDNRFG